MPFLLILLGALLLVVALQGTYSQLASDLEQDLPGFVKWGAAIGAIGATGYIPGFRTPSRYLLALVLLVIFMRNYQSILAGFTSLSSTTPQPTSSVTNPAEAYAINAGAVSNTTSGSTTAATPTSLIVVQPNSALANGSVNDNANAYGAETITSPFGAFDPLQYEAQFQAAIGGGQQEVVTT